MGLSPELAYPLPTTDQEVHQIRMLVCEILAAAWWRAQWAEHGVCPFDEPFWAGGCCCSGHFIVVPALADSTPDLRRGVVAVFRWGREVVVWGAEADGSEGGAAGWCSGLFPLFGVIWVRLVVVLRWGSA